MPGALDDVAAEVAVGEGRALVGAEVLDGAEFAADVEEREFLAAGKLDGRAAAFGQVLDAGDRQERALAARPPGVDESAAWQVHTRRAS